MVGTVISLDMHSARADTVNSIVLIQYAIYCRYTILGVEPRHAVINGVGKSYTIIQFLYPVYLIITCNKYFWMLQTDLESEPNPITSDTFLVESYHHSA